MALLSDGQARRGRDLSWLALLAVLLLALGPASVALAERVRDIASIQGVRSNQLVGYGLVVGLDGTGDQTTQTPFTVQSLQSMLTQLGINLPPGTNLQLKNTAAVMVTAQLPAFARPGQALDVTVSSVGNAKSLRGGTLLMTPLKGADGRIYALAQGNLAIPGAGASAGGSKVQVNQLNAGRIPAGATVERDVPSALAAGGVVRFELAHTDFAGASHLASMINQRFPGIAVAEDARVVRVRLPANADVVAWIGAIENIEVDLPPAAARVVINARTGSIVMNRAVSLLESAVAHGNLNVTISSEAQVSQPEPYSLGETVVTEKADVRVEADTAQMVRIPPTASLVDVVKALNALGATPQDLLSILQALKAAGALRAELEII